MHYAPTVPRVPGFGALVTYYLYIDGQPVLKSEHRIDVVLAGQSLVGSLPPREVRIVVEEERVEAGAGEGGAR